MRSDAEAGDGARPRKPAEDYAEAEDPGHGGDDGDAEAAESPDAGAGDAEAAAYTGDLAKEHGNGEEAEEDEETYEKVACWSRDCLDTIIAQREARLFEEARA